MGLCGSFRCGCGVTSTPAVAGAINGELPSIVVTGSGEPSDPYDLTLNDAWSALVAQGYGAWTAWGPDLTQTVAVPSSCARCVYTRFGRFIVGSFEITAGGSGTSGGVITVSLPVPAAATSGVVGAGYILDNGTAFYACTAVLTSTTTMAFYGYNVGTFIGAAVPAWALASTDKVAAMFAYDAAS
jgi:hypothetical protein